MKKFRFFCWIYTTHKKSFPLTISSVNLTKSAVSCGFSHIYWIYIHFIFFVQWQEILKKFSFLTEYKKFWRNLVFSGEQINFLSCPRSVSLGWLLIVDIASFVILTFGTRFLLYLNENVRVLYNFWNTYIKFDHRTLKWADSATDAIVMHVTKRGSF